MKNVLILIIGLALGAGGFWLVSSHRAESAAHEKVDKEKEADEKPAHDEDVIKLNKKQQAAAGIEIGSPAPIELSQEVKGYGRILDPSQFVSLVLDVQAAQTTAEASKKELDRSKTLFSQGQNASARTLETAEAAAKRDELLFNVASSKLRAAFGPSILQRPDFSEIIQMLSQMQWSLARIDLPSAPQNELGATARIAPLANDSPAINAEILGPAPTADLSVQGRGYLALIKTNSFSPNTAIAGSIETPDHTEKGFLIPSKAVLQEGPETIVFVQSADDAFKKTPIEISRTTDKGAFVTEGLSATNRVVISGAHQILSVTKAEAAD